MKTNHSHFPAPIRGPAAPSQNPPLADHEYPPETLLISCRDALPLYSDGSCAFGSPLKPLSDYPRPLSLRRSVLARLTVVASQMVNRR